MILKTERTTVRKLSIDDAAFILELVNSPGWLRFIGDRNVNNESESVEFLRNGFLHCYDQYRFGYYLIQASQAESIGICGFLKKPFLENVDFGFALLPNYHGLGYGFEAGKAILQYGVNEFGFQTLDAVTDPANDSSRRLLEKLDFKHVGQIQSAPTSKPSELFRWTI